MVNTAKHPALSIEAPMTRTPLYRKVEAHLRSLVHEAKPGDLIPTQVELQEKFGVSKATVQKAVELLVSEGWLVKRQGFGTTVRRAPQTQNVGQIYSWTDEAQKFGGRASSSQITLSLQQPSNKVSKELHMPRGEKVLVLSRIRKLDDIPIVLMTNYLKPSKVPGLLSQGLQSDSLYRDLREIYGVVLTKGEETIRARIATPFEAAALETEPNSAVLDVHRIAYINTGEAVEVVDMVARSDSYQYRAVLSGEDRKAAN